MKTKKIIVAMAILGGVVFMTQTTKIQKNRIKATAKVEEVKIQKNRIKATAYNVNGIKSTKIQKNRIKATA